MYKEESPKGSDRGLGISEMNKMELTGITDGEGGNNK